MWEIIDSDLLETDLPCAVYWDTEEFRYTGWYLGKDGAPEIPTNILWDIDDSSWLALIGQVTAIALGEEFGPIPEKTVNVGIKFVPSEITSYTGTFTTDSSAEEQASVSLSGDWIITTVYVKKDAAGTGSGIDWTNAMTDLSIAVNKARDEVIPNVHVAYGVYTPAESYYSGKGPRFRSFRMYNGITVKGSFTGNILDPEEQDSSDPSILSGDLGTDSCYHTLFIPDGQGLNSTAVMQDIVITGGKADRYRGVAHTTKGGGIYCGTGNSPVFTGVSINLNTAVLGGGVYIREALPVFNNCSALENTAEHGGGFYYDNCDYSAAAVNNLEVAYNIATGSGGGIHNNNSVIPMLSTFIRYNKAALGGGYCQAGHTSSGSFESADGTDPYFFDNRAVSGGGIAVTGGTLSTLSVVFITNKAVSGGGIITDDSSVSVKDALFYRNEADNGGAVMTRNSYAILDRNTYSFNKAFKNGGAVFIDKNTYSTAANSVFNDNMAVYGAGVYTGRSDTLLAGITAVRNSASISGGFVYGRQCEISVYGCAMQDNTPHNLQLAGDRVEYVIKYPAMHTPGQIFEVIAEGGRIETTDLGFMYYSNDNFYPVPGSVLTGTGDLSYFPEGMTYDRYGTARNSAGFTNIGAYDSSI